MKLKTLEDGSVDLVLDSTGALLPESTLQTAVLVSLLTERRAELDDKLPYTAKSSGPIPPDRKGWAGDAFGGQRIGSRLWLLVREKQTEETRRRAMFYAREALQWLIDDGYVSGIAIEAVWRERGRMDMRIQLELPNGMSEQFTITTGVVYAV
jgi:phage gp46-like protein